MQRFLRYLAPLALLIAAMALVACGGDDAETGGSPVDTEDPQAILEQTFAEDASKKVESGRFDLQMTVAAEGGGSPLQNPIEVSIAGPFQSMGEKQVPKFDIDVTVSGIPGQEEIKAGATSTGDAGFVNYLDQEYAVSDEVFQQFKTGFEQASAEQSGSQATLASLGIEPQNWIKDPQADDGSSVGDTDTVKVTGAIDLPVMLADVNDVLSNAGSLGVPDTGQLPTQLTDEQIAQVEEAVTEANVEIETGKEDSILRRMAFTVGLEDPAGSGGNANIDFDLSLTELNEEQEISAPENTKPFEELLGQLGGLGGLGALGGLGGAGASTGGGASAEAQAEFTQCVADAGSDTAKAQQCASLLAP